jgi:hypothetical protein
VREAFKIKKKSSIEEGTSGSTIDRSTHAVVLTSPKSCCTASPSSRTCSRRYTAVLPSLQGREVIGVSYTHVQEPQSAPPFPHLT